MKLRAVSPSPRVQGDLTIAPGMRGTLESACHYPMSGNLAFSITKAGKGPKTCNRPEENPPRGLCLPSTPGFSPVIGSWKKFAKPF
jgi:hypothetical protein